MNEPMRIGVLGAGNIAARALLAPAMEVPDVAVAAVGSRHLERARAYAVTTTLARATAMNTLQMLLGGRGRLVVKSLYVPQWGGALRLEWDGRASEEPADPTPRYVFQLHELVRCIRDGAPVLTSVDNGALNMRAIDAVHAAARPLPPSG